MRPRDPALQRLRRHRIPTWWQDAKLGIFIHWTIASVPAFAPIGTDFSTLLKSEKRDAYSLTPYVEWYENSLRFPSSPVAKFHRENFGDRPYRDFREEWEAGLEQWDPVEWATKFAATGAKYVVLVSKHADGYCLWPTSVDNPRRPGWHCERDVVGELASAVRAAGMRFGLYYSGGMDWTFNQRPVGAMGDVIASIPRGDYVDYADAQVRELIDRYEPSVLWNDIAWPGEAKSLWSLFEYYYDKVPDGVVNDRWLPWNTLLSISHSEAGRRLIDAVTERAMNRDGGLIPPPPPHYDVRTPEYVVFPEIQSRPWECVRGMDESFGHNASSRPEDFISRSDLLWLLSDIVSKNGNLLLNVGPDGRDATIPDEQARRLEWLAEWTSPNATAFFGTRPWIDPGDTLADGTPVRYTSAGDSVFAYLQSPGTDVVLQELRSTATTSVARASGEALPWSDTSEGLRIELGTTAGPDPVVVALHHVEARRLAPTGRTRVSTTGA